MIHLTQRTEYSFRNAAGKLDEILALNPEAKASGICDKHGTWGHPSWQRACKKKGIKPIFGVELVCVTDSSVREKQRSNDIRIIAKNGDGLKEMYEIVSLATENFYYTPRTDYTTLLSSSPNVAIFLGPLPDWSQLPEELPEHFYFELNQSTSFKSYGIALERGMNLVATDDNLYPTPSDKDQ